MYIVSSTDIVSNKTQRKFCEVNFHKVRRYDVITLLSKYSINNYGAFIPVSNGKKSYKTRLINTVVIVENKIARSWDSVLQTLYFLINKR